MTDIHARLTDALPKYLRLLGISKDDAPNAAEYLADALVSLPGIAIVELPEANSATGCWSISTHKDLRVEHGEVVQILPRSSGMTESYRSPDLVRKIAAALLAAANAAEGI
jgi:hypothetical protein